MSLVTSDWLENNLSDVKIIDCSWHMPGIDRNPKEEYSKNHIPGAIFFDLDKNSDQDTDLPHMLPTKEKWEEIVSSMGISNTDRIVIYDNSDVLSSCRGWYNFIYFGHDKHLVSVLDGGLKKWLIEYRKTTSEKTILNNSTYRATENKNMVKSMAKNPIIFACANPDPEITPEEIEEVRNDAIIATGRSDYPNQVNNLIGFPYIFRGALDVRSKTINFTKTR